MPLQQRGAAAHELDPEDFFLPGALIDVRSHAARDDDDAVSARDLEAWESAHGLFPAECAVIVNTGWHTRGPAERDDDLDPDGTQRHPGFAPDAARRLLDRRGALGTDASSPDVTFSVSEILSREHRLSLEVLANLDRLPRRRPRPPAETVSARVAARNQRGLAKRLSPLPGRPRAAADAALGIECRRAGAGVLRWKGRVALRKDLPSEPARARFGARRTLRSRHGRLFSR